MTTASLQIDTSVGTAPGTHTMATNSPAFETTLISYANKILKYKSPSSAHIDASLAPYVTAILRAALSNLSQTDLDDLQSESSSALGARIDTIAEYEALVELLMEQCEMTSIDAHSALNSIARAIQTGEFQYFGNRHRSLSLSMNMSALHHQDYRKNSFNSNLVGNGVMPYRGFGSGNSNSIGKFRSKSMGAENDYYCQDDAIRLLGDMLKENMESAEFGMGYGMSSDAQLPPGTSNRRHRSSLDATMSNCTLPHWSVAKRQDSAAPLGGVRNAIEEEPSFFLEEDEAPYEETPRKTPLAQIISDGLSGSDCNITPSANFLTGGLSPFLTDEEKKVAEDLKNLAAPTFSFTPLKQDQLIPIDLLGVIDDPSTPSNDLSKQKVGGNISGTTGPVNDEVKYSGPVSSEDDDGQKIPFVGTPMKSGVEKNITRILPFDTVASPHLVRSESVPTPQAKLNLSGKGQRKGKKKDNDLAAALFSRPRSMSITYDERSPKLKPMAPPSASKIGMSGLKNCSADVLRTHSIPALFQKQLESAIEILLAMNYDIGRDAAHEAALVSNADVNVAQHVIDGALSAPPVCRHMLNDGCYRSDCHFSHDVDGHTCLFWLRGRCGKVNSCRFMHGFSEKLLDGVTVDFRNAPQDRDEEPTTLVLPPAQSLLTKPIAIKTGNLVQHNMKASFSFSNSNETRGMSSSPRVSFAESAGGVTRTGSLSDTETLGSSIEQNKFPLSHSPTGPTPTPTPIPTEAKSSPPSTFSFASIASKGYSKQSFFNTSKPPLELSGIANALVDSKKTVKIPQNLWTASQNRASGAFHISDPIARYKEVSTTVQRADVVDLHFQSVKTFPAVLSSIMPVKLKDHGEVWIVTGSGHHVSRSSHQKGGGVLENAVIGWLVSNDYNYSRGKDKNGFGGAVLVHGR